MVKLNIRNDNGLFETDNTWEILLRLIILVFVVYYLKLVNCGDTEYRFIRNNKKGTFKLNDLNVKQR